jgi:hypothetical protein
VPGRLPKVSGAQPARLYELIVGRDPRQLSFEFALWTREMVRDLIRREFGEDLLTNPRHTIRWLYEEEHPEWRLDRNATFALPPAVWDTITRHSAEIGIPAKRLMTALVVAYFTERGIAIKETPRH